MGRRTTWWHIVIVPVVLVALAGVRTSRPVRERGPLGAPTTTATREVTPEPSVEARVLRRRPPDGGSLTSTGTVTEVVDGDTIKVDGQSVRLIGMDSPEAGQCGYDEATAAMAGLVAGRVVTLTAVAGRDDVDRYGRLLRYVEVDGTDVGLREIELGLAIARYDGRDGYGTHPRQDAYIAADAAAADVTCATPEPTAEPAAPAEPAPLVGPAADANCDPSYPTVCIPPAPPDLDCGDITFRRFTVLPPDPHHFDGNHDGVGCESG